MKISYYDTANKNRIKKIEFLKNIIISIIIFIITFLVFYLVVGNSNELYRSLIISIEITLLIHIAFIIYDIIENRINYYVIKNNSIKVIYPHHYTSNYEDSMISYDAFRKNMNDEEIRKSLNDCVIKLKKDHISKLLNEETDLNRIVELKRLQENLNKLKLFEVN